MANNMHEELKRMGKLVANLAKEIDVKNQMLQEVERKYNKISASLSRMMEEKEKLHQGYMGVRLCTSIPPQTLHCQEPRTLGCLFFSGMNM
uniref:Uncharacterized protein n=1 Tax=Nelumbo nucifera TaxID=4432 RepID=A0A822Y1V7_NELNU|nr:TPA_asm: hypothetical protein HUJ06_027905 [Nelumbo nucifera]